MCISRRWRECIRELIKTKQYRYTLHSIDPLWLIHTQQGDVPSLPLYSLPTQKIAHVIKSNFISFWEPQ